MQKKLPHVCPPASILQPLKQAGFSSSRTHWFLSTKHPTNRETHRQIQTSSPYILPVFFPCCVPGTLNPSPLTSLNNGAYATPRIREPAVSAPSPSPSPLLLRRSLLLFARGTVPVRPAFGGPSWRCTASRRSVLMARLEERTSRVESSKCVWADSCAWPFCHCSVFFDITLGGKSFRSSLCCARAIPSVAFLQALKLFPSEQVVHVRDK